jgi:hypothetical protein
MLQRLTVALLHTVCDPGKVAITFHRHLASQIRQCMPTGVARFALESLPKALPVLPQFRFKNLDLFNRYSPASGIKQTFFPMFIRSVLPQPGLM